MHQQRLAQPRYGYSGLYAQQNFGGGHAALAGEKHVSGLYDTSVFEFRDGQARNVLNHIQKEEQEHGKQLYDYMTVNGMYQ